MSHNIWHSWVVFLLIHISFILDVVVVVVVLLTTATQRDERHVYKWIPIFYVRLKLDVNRTRKKERKKETTRSAMTHSCKCIIPQRHWKLHLLPSLPLSTVCNVVIYQHSPGLYYYATLQDSYKVGGLYAFIRQLFFAKLKKEKDE